MIPTLLYVSIGLLVAATIMVIIEKRDIPDDDDGEFCDHCSSKAITRENGTPLCETHLNEYKARHG